MKPNRKKEIALSHKQLLLLLRYDLDTGRFYRLQQRSGNAKAGAIAGFSVGHTGYRAIKICDRQYLEHRLAYFYMLGEWPEAEIDHINRDKSDNRWINLRQATRSQNCENQGIRCNNKHGLIGVSFNKRQNKYSAKITKNKKQIHLGYFDTAEMASNAYLLAKQSVHSFSKAA